MITQSFNLNVIPESSPVIVHCDQYDTGTGRLVARLFDDSVAYTPSNGATAVIQGTKPDGHSFNYNATISGNSVTADLTQQMSACAGHVRCQFVITETYGRTGTFIFILDVQRSALPDNADMSESDLSIIEQAIDDAQQAAEDANGYAEDAEAWAVGERGGVPVTSGDPTYDNNAEYWAGIAQQYAQGTLRYKGSVAFANIPTTGLTQGDMYNITDDFTTDSRFAEGAGIKCPAGTNIAWNGSKWDLLAVVKVSSLADLGDVSLSTLANNDGLFYNASTQKFENKAVPLPDMTSSTKGVGKPDGKTTEVSSGTFSAIGVSIPADVNSGGTQYGSNWLYYAGTTEVITPSTKQNYRVTDNGTTKLYYWTGSVYEELAGSGGGGGMNTNGSNAASTVGMTNTKVFTIGDRTGKANAGTEAIELGSGGNATGYGATAEGAKGFGINGTSCALLANTSSETLVNTVSLTLYPYQAYSLTGDAHIHSNAEVFVDGGLAQDETITDGNVTVRLTQDGTNIKAYYTNTDSVNHHLFYAYQPKQNTASGDNSHVEGNGNTASGTWSHAEGTGTTASGEYGSHAEGFQTTASSHGAHAEGRGTIASGMWSHAEGNDTRATSPNSHAEGYGTRAASWYQHASGKYNAVDSSDTYAVIVGNGTADNARSNALTLDWDGNLMAAGRLTDANGQIYDKTVALTQSEYQTLVDNDEDDPDTEYFIEDIDVAEAYYVETSGQTAITGATSLTFTNSHIKPTADIRILAEPASCKVSTNPQYKVSAKLSTVGNGTATITFPALAENTEFWLLIECPLPVTVDPAYVYNTDETVIGQWIDGKPLYRKTVVRDNITINKWEAITYASLGINDVDYINQVGKGKVHYVQGTNSYWFSEFYNNNGSQEEWVSFLLEAGNVKDFRIVHSYTASYIVGYVITFEYTKTTD